MGLFNKITTLFRGKDVQDFIDAMEDVLLESGLAPSIVYDILEDLNTKAKGLKNPETVIARIKEILMPLDLAFDFSIPQSDNIHVYLFVGVNGVGKTTSVAKLAYLLIHTYHINPADIVVAAGDTFRAAATEQLEKHCNTLGISLIRQHEGADPAAVIYDAITHTRAHNKQFVLADTAGRMNNRNDLIQQLSKIYRIITRDLALNNITTMITLDGNSGLNTVNQVEDFSSAIPIDAIILTKFDGSARGGALLSVSKRCGIPCAFLGTGEKYEHLRKFNKEDFLDEFLSQ